MLLFIFVTELSWLYKFIVRARIDIVKNNFVIVLCLVNLPLTFWRLAKVAIFTTNVDAEN